MGIIEFEQPNVLHAGLSQQVSGGLGRAPDLCRLISGGAHRRYMGQRFEAFAQGRKQVIDGRDKVFMHIGRLPLPDDRQHTADVLSDKVGAVAERSEVGRGSLIRSRR